MKRLRPLICLLIVVVLAAAGLTGAAVAQPARSLPPPYIVWWGDAKKLKNVTMVSPAAPKNLAFWRAFGIKAGGHVGLGRAELGYIDKGEATEFRRRLEQRVAQGYTAITLEIERRTDARDAAVLKDFKAAHPDVFISAWLLGLDKKHPYSLLKPNVDLFIYEVYTDLGHDFGRFDEYIRLAKRENILNKSVFGLSLIINSYFHLEQQLRYIRTRAPAMPGVAFFYYRGRPDDFAVDDLAAEYFIKPVIIIEPGSLTYRRGRGRRGQIILSVKVRNIGRQAGPAAVDFWEGNADVGANIIAENVGRRLLAPQTATIIRYRWRPIPGRHRIFARLYPSPFQPLPRRRETRAVIVTKRAPTPF